MSYEVNSMANSSRRKHKAIAKITYDELLDSSSMQGFVSFLDQVPPTLGRAKTNSAPDQFSAPPLDKQQVINAPSLGIPNDVTNAHLGDARQFPEFVAIPSSSGIPNEVTTALGNAPQFPDFAAAPGSSGIPSERSMGTLSVRTVGIPNDQTARSERPSAGIPHEVTNTPGNASQFADFAAAPGSSGIPSESSLSAPIPGDPTGRPSVGIPHEVTNTPGDASRFAKVAVAPGSPGISDESSVGIPNVGSFGILADPALRTPTEHVQPARLDVLDQPPPRNIYNQILERHLKLQRANLAQDAHSSSENAVYDFLWREGKALIHEGRRQIVVGYGMVAGKLKLGRNTVIRAVESLEKKLAIERLGGQGNSGQRYLVYSYAETLNRRRMAGLVWYVKNRNGRLLLSEKDLETPVVSLTRQGSMGIPGNTSQGIPRKNSPIPTLGTPGIPSVGTPGVPNEQTPPYRIDENTLSIRYVDDQAVEILEQHLLKTEFAGFDRKAITTIWRQSRATVPDITPDEVLEIFFGKAQVLARSRTVENKNGLLIWAWPSLLTPARVAQLREKRHLEKEVTSADSNEYLAKLHRILSDPEASEEEKRLVKQVLQMTEKESDH